MPGEVDQIYLLKNDVPPAAAATPRPRRAISRRFILSANLITWAAVVLFLAAGGLWAYRAGINLRRDVWQSTRSIRFTGDIWNAFRWGDAALRHAEATAHLQRYADTLADQSPQVLARAGRQDLLHAHSAGFRRLTTSELIDGIVSYYDSIENARPEGDYDVDYPPGRLAIMTLWVRHVQRNNPRIAQYPREVSRETSSGRPEDIAEPLLEFNTACAGIAALVMFLLVWLWVARGSRLRFRSPAQLWRQWTVPHGLLAFMVVTAGFWYAFIALAPPPPRPTPAVSVEKIERQPNADRATIDVIINAEDSETRGRVDWGSSILYDHTQPLPSSDSSLEDRLRRVRIGPFKPDQTIHFRVWASNDNGSSTTDDFSFRSDSFHIDPDNPKAAPLLLIDSAPVGGILWPDWSVWLRILALFIGMIVTARILPPIHRGWACGAVAAMLVWFDPLTILNSHAWPQWDVWILPIFLLATLLASLNCWLIAGLVIGAGCMFKGQLLLGAPILFLWPLLGGRFGAFVRILSGVAIGAAIMVWPWIVRSTSADLWIESVIAAALVILIGSWLRSTIRQSFHDGVIKPLFAVKSRADLAAPAQNIWDRPLTLAIIVAALALAACTLATLLLFRHMPAVPLGGGAKFWLLLLVLVPPWFLRRRSLIFWLAAVFAAAVWVSSFLFPSSDSWMTLGFTYGSVKHDQMQMSVQSFSNLATLLSQRYGWDVHDILGKFHFTLSLPHWGAGWLNFPGITWTWASDLEVKTSLAIVYAACLLLSSLAAAVHSRRKDPRFLVAILIPWLAFPLLMAQMGGRYLLWSSALSAAMVAVSTGLSLLHLMLAIFAAGIVAHQLLQQDPQRWPQLFNFFTPMYPTTAWMFVLLVLIFLVAAFVPSKRAQTDGLE